MENRTFNDVCSKYKIIGDKLIELNKLLVTKLNKQKLPVSNSASFEDLIHQIDNIITPIYDINDNIEPSDEINEMITKNLSNYNKDLAERIIYYIRWLRYYLAKKGVSLSLLNKAKTLEDHILLIDFVDRIKDTTIHVNFNSVYYGNNKVAILVEDDNGEKVTDGYLIIVKDGIRTEQALSDEITIYIDDLDTHHYTFQYQGNDKYNDSNIVNFTLTAQPMPITFSAELTNSTQRTYMSQSSNPKGYIDDSWNLTLSTIDINNENVNIIKSIKIYDDESPRDFEEFDYLFIEKFLKHNNENNNEPIKIIIEVEDEIYYDFNTTLIELYADILYPFHQVSPETDYTGKDSYTFAISFYDELTNEPLISYDNNSATLILSNDENYFSSVLETFSQNTIYLNINNNLQVGLYDIRIVTEPNQNIDFNITVPIEILSNYVYSAGIVYLNDEPSIQILNNQANNTNIRIAKITGSSIDEDTSEEIYETIDTYISIQTDENNYVTLPNEVKGLGKYIVYITNLNTEENVQYNYDIKEPYTYDFDYIFVDPDNLSGETLDEEEPENDEEISSEDAEPENNTEENEEETNINMIKIGAIFKINIEDIEDFDITHITDYIKTLEHNTELEYQYYIEDDNNIVVAADITYNRKFRGKNTFWININDYEKTEEFILLNQNDDVFDISDIEIGDNEVYISCYDDEITDIEVTIIHNGNPIGTHSLSIDGENFIFNQNFPEQGDYTFNIVILNGNNEEKEYVIHLDRNILKIQDFKFDTIIDNEDEPATNNCLGFGFTNKNKIDEDISIIFYYDTPTNILKVDTINAQDSSYHTYLDVFLGDLPEGWHTIYAQFNSNSEYYQSFLISKTFCNTISTRIIYDHEFGTIGVADTVPLSLLTLDEQNNIVQKGYYFVNGQRYDINDEIFFVPDHVGQYTLSVEYIGQDQYKNSSIDIVCNVEAGWYNYYASSKIGVNTNNGLYPATPVKDVDTLLDISQPNDLLCLMAGQYETEIINENTIMYGYHKDNIENIRLSLTYIAPNTSLTLKNLMLDTGNGYTAISGEYQFVNSSNETVEISTIPAEIISSNEFVDIYEIDMKDTVTVSQGNTEIITGTITKNNEPVEGKLIKLYEYDNIIKAALSDANGEFIFNVNFMETTRIIARSTNCSKHVFVNCQMNYHPLLNGNDKFITIQNPELSSSGGIMTGGAGYIDKSFSNLVNWEIEFDAIASGSNTGITIPEYGVDKRAYHNLLIEYRGNTPLFSTEEENTGHFRHGWDFSDWKHFKITKLNNEQFKFNVEGYSEVIFAWGFFKNLLNLSLGVDKWKNTSNQASIKNIYIKQIVPEKYYLNNTEEIELKVTESLTTTQNQNPVINNNIMTSGPNQSGYLTKGFLNSSYWEINLEAKVYDNNTCNISITQKGVDRRDYERATVRSDGNVYATSIYGNRIVNWVPKTNAFSQDWTPVTIKRISDTLISFKVGDGEEAIEIWNSLPHIETLCIGLDSWGGQISIRNIIIKNTILEE